MTQRVSYSGQIAIPFEFTLAPIAGKTLLDTYHGVTLLNLTPFFSSLFSFFFCRQDAAGHVSRCYSAKPYSFFFLSFFFFSFFAGKTLLDTSHGVCSTR